MSIILLILGFACLGLGLAGAVLPLPGPPLSYVGLWLLRYSGYAHFNKSLLVLLGLATAIAWFLDYYVPIWGTKQFGGTRYGVWGSTIGLLLGFFIIPGLGLFLGAFLGALIGELIGGSNTEKSLKAAVGSFVGLMAGIVMKVALCLLMIYYGIVAVL